MGPPRVLVCSCVGKIQLSICKLMSFLCSLDNFLLKKVIVFCLGNQISKWHPFKKRPFLTYHTKKYYSQMETFRIFQDNQIDFFFVIQGH